MQAAGAFATRCGAESGAGGAVQDDVAAGLCSSSTCAFDDRALSKATTRLGSKDCWSSGDADDVDSEVEYQDDEELYSDGAGDDEPTHITLYHDTDSEGEPEEWCVADLWPSRRRPCEAPGRCGAARRPEAPLEADAKENKDAAPQAQATSEPPQTPSIATTLVVRNLTDHTTQQDFLDVLDRSGFVGSYDFAYLPFKRRGHAFVNFISAEVAAAFTEAWHGSTTLLGVRPGAAALDVCPSAVQGFRENAAKWTPERMRQVRSPPFIYPVCEERACTQQKVGRESHRAEVTTLVVRNLSEHVTQQDLLLELDVSGFAGSFDFAYLPCNFSSGRGSGLAFVNFKSMEIAAAFTRVWHKSTRLGVRPGFSSLDVATATLQGFHANASKWTSLRTAKVKNIRHIPFICPTAMAMLYDSGVMPPAAGVAGSAHRHGSNGPHRPYAANEPRVCDHSGRLYPSPAGAAGFAFGAMPPQAQSGGGRMNPF